MCVGYQRRGHHVRLHESLAGTIRRKAAGAPVYAVQSAREGLRDGIDAESRRKLLRLLDAQNTLLVESTLMSFTAGFKLAAGIAGELGTPYSFDADEEQKAKEMITNG